MLVASPTRLMAVFTPGQQVLHLWGAFLQARLLGQLVQGDGLPRAPQEQDGPPLGFRVVFPVVIPKLWAEDTAVLQAQVVAGGNHLLGGLKLRAVIPLLQPPGQLQHGGRKGGFPVQDAVNVLDFLPALPRKGKHKPHPPAVPRAKGHADPGAGHCLAPQVLRDAVGEKLVEMVHRVFHGDFGKKRLIHPLARRPPPAR